MRRVTHIIQTFGTLPEGSVLFFTVKTAENQPDLSDMIKNTKKSEILYSEFHFMFFKKQIGKTR